MSKNGKTSKLLALLMSLTLCLGMMPTMTFGAQEAELDVSGEYFSEETNTDLLPEDELDDAPQLPYVQVPEKLAKESEISLFGLVGGTLEVTGFETGNLEAAVLAENDDSDDYSGVYKLIISDGELNKDDCTFIKENLSNVYLLDFSGATFENNRILENAFGDIEERYLGSLLEVVLPNSVKSIGAYAFAGTRLTTIDISKVTSLGEGVFYSCTYLRDFGSFNDAITKLPDEFFYHCSSLTGKIALNKITVIGNSAFYYSAIGTIDLTNVTKLGENCFNFCRSLRDVTLGTDLTEIPKGAFTYCKSLESIDLSNVTYLGDLAFSQCESLDNIYLSNITTLGESTFHLCTNLKNIGELNANLTEIPISAFNSTAITSFDFSNISKIGSWAFSGCMGLTEIDPGNVEFVGQGAFRGCKNLKTVSSFNKPTKIDKGAFEDCVALETVDLANVVYLGKSAFWNCYELVSVGDLNSDLTEIMQDTFISCVKLEAIDLSNIVTIGSRAFGRCEWLKSVDLSNVEEIGLWAFAECSNLYDVQWPVSATYADESFADCALDFSPYTMYGETFPTGITADTLNDIAQNQTPKVFFELPANPMYLQVGATFDDPYTLKTINGSNMDDVIADQASNSSWLNPAFSATDITVTRVPATGVSIDTSVAGGQNITYSIPETTYANANTLNLRLEVVAPVTDITVYGNNNATAITQKGGTLQMRANFTPENATVKEVIWTVKNGTGSATISDTGLLTATGNGTVTVIGTARDGFGAQGSTVITISGQNDSSGSSGGGGGGGGSVKVTSTTLTVEGLDENNNIIYSKDETVTIGKDKTVEAPTIEGYTLNDDGTKTITVKSGTNKVSFVYTKNKTEILPLEPLIPLDSLNPFSDVKESDWFYDSVLYSFENGLFSGTSATTFSPNVPMIRGMFVTALGRLSGMDVSKYTQSSFSDVAVDSYYLGYIEWAKENGIVSGVGGGNFAPDDTITREQMALMLYNYTSKMNISLAQTKSADGFADSALISDWAKGAVDAMYRAEILSGKGENTFDPQGKATRAEVATMLQRFAMLAK